MSASPLQTEEELLSVKDCVILPILLDVLERDIRSMKHTGISDYYVFHLQTIQKMTFAKLAELKKLPRTRHRHSGNPAPEALRHHPLPMSRLPA